MRNKICIAVVGCGRIAQAGHFPALHALKDRVRIKYVCDLIPEKANAAKAAYPDFAENAVTDYRELLADKEVEAVWVLTSNLEHHRVTMDALKAGKHVFCEKPITVSYPLSLEMAQAAERYGKLLCIGVCNRYQRSVELLEKMNREGKFGKLYHVYCSFRKYRCIPGLGGAFTTKAESGGGVLIDWGVHFFDLIFYVLGGAKLKTVTCDAYGEMAKDMKDYVYLAMHAEDTKNLEGKFDVDDFVSGYIRTDKASVSFNGAWAQNVDRDEMYVDFLGDKGGARLDYCGMLTYYTVEDGVLETRRPAYNIPDMYTEEDRAFLDAIASGGTPKNEIHAVLESAKLLDALYESSAKKKELAF
ncbi:MAG: Gfo/Idh/MocA family oxidoreductase [Clostridia bacterium]|nr:Gfo/Idh/MocA family oxidoreductase [Clostridia bacterium]